MAKLREVPDPQFVNLIAGCLEWDPVKRLSPDAGLNHEWILKGLPPGVLQQHQSQFKQEQRQKQSRSMPKNAMSQPEFNNSPKKKDILEISKQEQSSHGSLSPS